MRLPVNLSRARRRRRWPGADASAALGMVALMSVALATARPAAVAPAFGAAVQTASATSSGVLVWPGADSFKAGSLLLDRMASNHYSIYTVRREARGRVELHERDMDIVLVLE